MAENTFGFVQLLVFFTRGRGVIILALAVVIAVVVVVIVVVVHVIVVVVVVVVVDSYSAVITARVASTVSTDVLTRVGWEVIV